MYQGSTRRISCLWYLWKMIFVAVVDACVREETSLSMVPSSLL